jgi:hypothetical protein
MTAQGRIQRLDGRQLNGRNRRVLPIPVPIGRSVTRTYSGRSAVVPGTGQNAPQPPSPRRLRLAELGDGVDAP